MISIELKDADGNIIFNGNTIGTTSRKQKLLGCKTGELFLRRKTGENVGTSSPEIFD